MHADCVLVNILTVNSEPMVIGVAQCVAER